MRLAGVCNKNPETTVSAHYRMGGLGGGIGKKPDDIFTAHLCSACHDAVDGRCGVMYSQDEIRLAFAEAVFRTQKKMIDRGIIKC